MTDEQKARIVANALRGTGAADCGDNSCLYRDRKLPGGMRTNGGCRCDDCPKCGSTIVPGIPYKKHRDWCPQRDWVPAHHLGGKREV